MILQNIYWKDSLLNTNDGKCFVRSVRFLWKLSDSRSFPSKTDPVRGVLFSYKLPLRLIRMATIWVFQANYTPKYTFTGIMIHLRKIFSTNYHISNAGTSLHVLIYWIILNFIFLDYEIYYKSLKNCLFNINYSGRLYS